MQQIINFLISYKNTLLFLLLFCISLIFTIESHSYHKSKIVSSANWLTGGIYNALSGVDQYFRLKKDNKLLVEENLDLRKQLLEAQTILKERGSVQLNISDSVYELSSGRVVANRYNHLDNYLLVNKGEKDSIQVDLGVITQKGIVGIVEQTAQNHSRVISILNSQIAVNVKLKKSNHFGTLTWNGENPQIIQVEDIPRLADVKKGDTITTEGRSLIFPPNLPVGKVVSFELEPGKNYYTINVQLFNDMTNLNYVYFINNKQKGDLQNLE
ncbi:rod shape-determining protein MreC [Mesonia sp. HuA40]|uniref:rod shape-determining protein MreC n=1 Tax=Mesonia sp. HuA40 TaxID=2602761 RepID=UPI0011C870FC|nr:rod shape-determining protein MreC [Mesonia sp. HuA40]TXK73578.1 rod shape-determining protein MreC [Mesonia sp. HuA40]